MAWAQRALGQLCLWQVPRHLWATASSPKPNNVSLSLPAHVNLSFWRLLVKERVAREGPQIGREGTSAVCDTDLRHPETLASLLWRKVWGAHHTPSRPYSIQTAELVVPEDF